MTTESLSAPAKRQLLHRRQIECLGYKRDDGLFDIEAHMMDSKAYSFDNRFRGPIAAGRPVHDMWIRLTIDDTLKIHAAEASTEASPYPMCPDITSRYQQLVGVRIGGGWRRQIKSLFGGVQGCTHLSELLGPLATTAFQTLVGQRRKKPGADDQPPPILDTCHAYARDGEIVKTLWPKFSTRED